MHDRPIILLPKGLCSESRNVFKCSEVNDNISETVQDRDIGLHVIAMEDLCGLSNGTIANTLE